MKRLISGFMASIMLISSICYGAQVFQGNVTGTSSNVTGTVAVANGGTGQTSASAGLNALLPSQTGNSGTVLGTNGTTASWVPAGSSGTVTSVGGTGTVSGLSLSGTVTSSGNLTLGGTLAGVTNSNLSGSAAISNANLANSSVTIGSTSVSLGGTASTISGLTLSSPTLTTPALGTPASGVATNLTGTASGLTSGKATNIAGGSTYVLPYQSAANTTGFIASSANSVLVTAGDGIPALGISLPNGIMATTQSPGDNSSKLATTAFVLANSMSMPTTAGTLSCTAIGGANVCSYSAAVSNAGTITLPTVTTGWGGIGTIVIGTGGDYAQFTTDASGNVNLVWSSAGVVANAATASKVQIGAATPANPIVVTNATGSAANITVTYTYH